MRIFVKKNNKFYMFKHKFTWPIGEFWLVQSYKGFSLWEPQSTKRIGVE